MPGMLRVGASLLPLLLLLLPQLIRMHVLPGQTAWLCHTYACTHTRTRAHARRASTHAHPHICTLYFTLYCALNPCWMC